MLPTSAEVTLLGSVAAACTTGAFVPQLVRVARHRRVRDISLAAFLVLTVGSALWATYGALIGSLPVLVANVVTLALVLATLILKVRYDRLAPPAA
jgi:MtN3 and saliva related transmembrane protein